MYLQNGIALMGLGLRTSELKLPFTNICKHNMHQCAQRRSQESHMGVALEKLSSIKSREWSIFLLIAYPPEVLPMML